MKVYIIQHIRIINRIKKKGTIVANGGASLNSGGNWGGAGGNGTVTLGDISTGNFVQDND